jgi:hypothetical protein
MLPEQVHILMPRPQRAHHSILIQQIDDFLNDQYLHVTGRGLSCWSEALSKGGFSGLGSSSQGQCTHQQQGKKSDTHDREKSHPQACPQRETLTVYPSVYGSAALLVWIEVRDLKFSFKSFFMVKFMQDAPLLQSCFLEPMRCRCVLYVNNNIKPLFQRSRNRKILSAKTIQEENMRPVCPIGHRSGLRLT